MGKIIKKNYESDFELTLRMPPKVGNCDFRLEFHTYRRDVVYTACRENGYLTPNLHEMGDGRFKVVLRNHGLGEGRLRVKAYCRLYNELSPDRHIVEVTPEYTGIELWSGPSDDAERLDVEEINGAEDIQEVGFLGSIGYTLKEEEVLFGADVNYSQALQEKWNKKANSNIGKPKHTNSNENTEFEITSHTDNSENNSIINNDTITTLTEKKVGIEEVDITKAATELATAQNALQASYALTSTIINGVSLLDYV